MFDLTREDEQRVKCLHEESVVVDSLTNHILSLYAEYSQAMLEKLDELIEKGVPTPAILYEMDRMHIRELLSGESHREQEWMELSGVDAFSMTVGVYGEPAFSYENAVRDIALWTRKFDSLDYLVKATSVKDIYRAKKMGKKAIIMNFQNTDHIGTDLGKLDLFYDLGIRAVQLTYNLQNFVGSGSLERTDAGLSHFGVQVVKRLNELGILVDVSHCGYQTTMDAIKTSRAPVAATHSFCRKLHDHPRGNTDEQLKALADNNGYLGIVVYPSFIAPPSRQASLEDFLDHLDHAVEIMGVDKIGIGTDYGKVVPEPLQVRLREEGMRLGHIKGYTGGAGATEGYRDHREWTNFTRGLISRGYTDDEIKGILGGNFLRILEQVVG
jgi:membrane dipeptidase